MCSFPELGGRYALFLFKEGRELTGIFKLQAVGNLRYVQVTSRKEFFCPQ